jgi:glycosyltransferase involved in cell wall biosynthesis
VELLQSCCARLVLVVPDNKRSPLHRVVFKALYWLRRVSSGECADRFYTMVPRMGRAIRRELAAQHYDVFFFSYWFWSPWVYESSSIKVIDANDLQWERHAVELARTKHPVERVLRPWLLDRYRRYEIEALRRADVVVACTTRDRDIFAAHTKAGTEHLVVPTGIDTEHFAPRAEPPDLRNVIFYGAMNNPMNQDAVMHLIDDILPRIRERLPDARLTIVGSNPSPELQERVAGEPNIVLTGYVSDVRLPLAQAGVVILPLRFGYGIRGRVFELLAMALPVIVSPVAVAGMGLEDGDGLLLADSPADFAAAVERVLGDPALRAALGRRGRALAESRLSLAATYDPLVEYLDARIEARRPGCESIVPGGGGPT